LAVLIAIDFDNSLKMPVCSRYGTDLFQRYFRSDGRSYNVSQRRRLIVGKKRNCCSVLKRKFDAVTVKTVWLLKVVRGFWRQLKHYLFQQSYPDVVQ